MRHLKQNRSHAFIEVNAPAAIDGPAHVFQEEKLRSETETFRVAIHSLLVAQAQRDISPARSKRAALTIIPSP
jgi:hypothetical protein